MQIRLWKRRSKMSETAPETVTSNAPETATPNANDVVKEDVVKRVEKTLEERVLWLEKELRKLLRLPEDAPLD